VSASAMVDELRAAGIRLSRDGGDLVADVLPGAKLDPYRDRIAQCRPALLAELDLREQIVAAATAAQSAFDRQHYDVLWERWHALQDQDAT
jgi:hypothetical protein